MNRLEKQLRFIIEIDRLKTVLRQTVLMDHSRQENSAEHSWHLALMAMLLGEYSQDAVDTMRVVQMVLVHDIVEIDAGDTFCYDTKARTDKAQREEAAADRIFNLLPTDQARQMRCLWDEFEAAQSPEARMARALDRLQPLLHNVMTEGCSWQKHSICKEQVLARNQHIAETAPALWTLVCELLDKAVEKGDLAENPSA